MDSMYIFVFFILALIYVSKSEIEDIKNKL